MKTKMQALLIISFYALSFTWAQGQTFVGKGPLEFYENEDASSEEKISQKREIHLKNETLLEIKSGTGIVVKRYYTGDDRKRLSFLGHINENLLGTKGLLGGEIQYGQRGRHFWYEFFFNQTKADFEAVSENRSGGPNDFNPRAEENFTRTEDSFVSMIQAGAGLGYRFKLNLDFWKTERIFQSTTAYFVYHYLKDNFRDDEAYRGPGFRVDYGLQHRLGPHLAYGPKLTYNFGIVTRQGTLEERNNERRLILSFLTLALELGYYF